MINEDGNNLVEDHNHQLQRYSQPLISSISQVPHHDSSDEVDNDQTEDNQYHHDHLHPQYHQLQVQQVVQAQKQPNMEKQHQDFQQAGRPHTRQ